MVTAERLDTVDTPQDDASESRAQLDPAALGEHRDRLFRAALAMCGSRDDAEDLVQSTYERVLRRPRFITRGHDAAYLLRVLRRAWSAQRRSAAHQRSQPVDPEVLEWKVHGGGDPQAALDAQLAYEAIAELSEPLRHTIVAVDIVGLSYKDAARSLRTRTGTIMSRLYRAREQVAAALEAPA
jgi:RNA polymerase sigma-70 factor, ECF subfamily